MGILKRYNQLNFPDSLKINFPDSLKIKEFKAPTDESLRLLKEMQEKALESILEVIPVVNNNVTFVIAPIQDPLNMGKFIVKVTINGNEHSTIIRNNFRSSYEMSEDVLKWFVGLFHADFMEHIFTRNING